MLDRPAYHALARAALTLTLPTLSFAQLRFELLAPDHAEYDAFGTAVALDGPLAVVGAPGDQDHGYDSGSAYVFDAVTGHRLQKLVPSDGAAGDRFGAAVAIDGNLVVVGAPADDDQGDNSGSAYVFDAWTGQELAKLLPSDGAAGDLFGVSVAVRGGTLLVGASGDDASSGSAYVFDASTWLERRKLVASDASSSDSFGVVALAGSLAVIGAPRADGVGGSSCGAAYLFDTTTGLELAKLVASDGAYGDRFGISVALDGVHVVVGAHHQSDNGSNAGAAYLFDTSSGLQLRKLLPSDGEPNAEFGISVGLAGDCVVVGSGTSDEGLHSGAVHRFRASTGDQVVKVFPPSGGPFDWFGCAVAVSGRTAIAGARGADQAGLDSGAAYVFQVHDPVGSSSCGPAHANSSGGSAAITAIGSDRVVDDSFEVHAEGLPPYQQCLLLVSRTQGLQRPPGSQGTLCLGGAIGRDLTQVRIASALGFVSQRVGLGALPGPNGTLAVQPGETWHFQYWFRDLNPTLTSNFTDSLSVTFR